MYYTRVGLFLKTFKIFEEIFKIKKEQFGLVLSFT